MTDDDAWFDWGLAIADAHGWSAGPVRAGEPTDTWTSEQLRHRIADVARKGAWYQQIDEQRIRWLKELVALAGVELPNEPPEEPICYANPEAAFAFVLGHLAAELAALRKTMSAELGAGALLAIWKAAESSCRCCICRALERAVLVPPELLEVTAAALDSAGETLQREWPGGAQGPALRQAAKALAALVPVH